ncbi:hypothetical protein, partial [Pseudomonas sp. CM25]|uniref:hypothetical protein n=1 Tax=Pseudomonas sp. CM25 TaxID=2738448 RepID=UPI001C49A028
MRVPEVTGRQDPAVDHNKTGLFSGFANDRRRSAKHRAPHAQQYTTLKKAPTTQLRSTKRKLPHDRVTCTVESFTLQAASQPVEEG